MKKLNSILEENILKEKLKSYKGIFSKEIYDYLEGLLALDISAMDKTQIDDVKLSKIKNFELYQDVSKFNNYTYVINLFSKNDSLFKISNRDDLKSLEVKCNYTDTFSNTLFTYNTTFDYMQYTELEINEEKRQGIIEKKLAQLVNDNVLIKKKFNNPNYKEFVDFSKQTNSNKKYYNSVFIDRNKVESELIELTLRKHYENEFLYSKMCLEGYMSELLNFFNIELKNNEEQKVEANDISKEKVLVGNTEFIRCKNYY